MLLDSIREIFNEIDENKVLTVKINGCKLFNSDIKGYGIWVNFLVHNGVTINEDGSYESNITNFYDAHCAITDIVCCLNNISLSEINNVYSNFVKVLKSRGLDLRADLKAIRDIFKYKRVLLPCLFFNICKEDLMVNDSKALKYGRYIKVRACKEVR